MFRYVHTNIIAKDCFRLIDFYKNVLIANQLERPEIKEANGWTD